MKALPPFLIAFDAGRLANFTAHKKLNSSIFHHESRIIGARPMLTLSIAIQKGGSGKTTTAINLAAALQQMGKRVLLIDLDPQANLTQALGFVEEVEPNLYHLLHQEAAGQQADLKRVMLQAGKLQLIPASLELANAELELVSVYGREQMLHNIIQQSQLEVDVLIIDCPPSVGMLTINALAASQYVLMPLQAEFLPLKGVQSFLKAFDRIQRQINPQLEILGFVLTKFDPRKKMTREIEAQLVEQFGAKVFETRIRSNISLAKAQEQGQDIFAYDQTSNGALDYLRLARELLGRVDA